MLEASFFLISFINDNLASSNLQIITLHPEQELA
jgi:hypothetical protein